MIVFCEPALNLFNLLSVFRRTVYASLKIGIFLIRVLRRTYTTSGENGHEKSQYTETQIVKILKEVEAGLLVKEVCREYGVSDATYYNWKAKYGSVRR